MTKLFHRDSKQIIKSLEISEYFKEQKREIQSDKTSFYLIVFLFFTQKPNLSHLCSGCAVLCHKLMIK